MTYYVYMLTNWNNKVLYTGVTNNIERRVVEHRSGAVEGFTKKYKVHKLVYMEETTDINDAIHREKQLKHLRRSEKDELIKESNPEWKDLLAE
jgi:putative endonuclease